MKRLSIWAAALSSLAFPAVALAADQKLSDIINTIIGYLNQVLVLLMGIAIVMFAWYVIKYYIKPNEERKEAGNYVLYSAIGFFAILSIWGLVSILQNTFGLKNTNNSDTFRQIQNMFPTSQSPSAPVI